MPTNWKKTLRQIRAMVSFSYRDISQTRNDSERGRARVLDRHAVVGGACRVHARHRQRQSQLKQIPAAHGCARIHRRIRAHARRRREVARQRSSTWHLHAATTTITTSRHYVRGRAAL